MDGIPREEHLSPWGRKNQEPRTHCREGGRPERSACGGSSKTLAAALEVTAKENSGGEKVLL